MELKILPDELSVCKLAELPSEDVPEGFFSLTRTDQEISLVCATAKVPVNTTDREDGWRAFRIEGILDFSLIGILAGISAVFAENKIGIFVVSTYNTDYILVKADKLEEAMLALKSRIHRERIKKVQRRCTFCISVVFIGIRNTDLV